MTQEENMPMTIKMINHSLVHHLFISLQLDLQFLVATILSVNRRNVPHISDPSIIVPFKLLLVGLDLLSELSALSLYVGYHGLNLLLRKLLATSLG